MSELHTEVRGQEIQSSSDMLIGEGYDLNDPRNIPGFRQTTNFKPRYATTQEEKKKGKTTIDKQFEYNTYIRDFFEDNQGRSLDEAITCWKYKKSLQGHNRYEKSDLVALD